MEVRKKFPKGTSTETIAAWAKAMADEVTGNNGNAELSRMVVVSVGTVGSEIPDQVIDSVLHVLGISAAKEDVVEFLDYRSKERKKTIKTERSLIRILKPFDSKPSDLSKSIQESMRQGWVGLFLPKVNGGSGGSRQLDRGESDGGTW